MLASRRPHQQLIARASRRGDLVEPHLTVEGDDQRSDENPDGVDHQPDKADHPGTVAAERAQKNDERSREPLDERWFRVNHFLRVGLLREWWSFVTAYPYARIEPTVEQVRQQV